MGASRLVSADRGSTSGSGRYPSAFRGPPPSDAARRTTCEPRGSFLLVGAALQALDGTRARFGGCQAQHLGASRLVSAGRGSTSGSVPERVSGPPSLVLPGAALGLAPPLLQHLGASRLVSAGRGSTLGSGRYPSACLDAARRSTWQSRGSFLLAGAALQDAATVPERVSGQHFRLWTVPERVSGPPPLDAARRSTWQPRGSFLLQQHFRVWTVPERVSGPFLDAAKRSTWEPRGWFLLAGAALQALDGTRARFGAPPLMPRGSFLLAGAALQALDGTRARFGAPPLDAARRSTWQPRGSFLLAGAALQALDGTRARFGASLLMLLMAGAALQALDGTRARFGAPLS